MHLDALSRRVIGVLLEKEATTPGQYPLSVNSLAAGCSQKSNRNPMMQVHDTEVESTLRDLYIDAWATNVSQPGSRTLKWKHRVEEKLDLRGKPIAVLAELLLRGDQQPGELRSRASRMVPIPDLANLESVVEILIQNGLARRLPPRPGERSGRIDHQLYAPHETQGDTSEAAIVAKSAALETADRKSPTSSLEDRPAAQKEDDKPSTSFADRICELESRMTDFQQRLERIESGSGHPDKRLGLDE
ncbi:MAG: DUF480 domain-containing protein [Planctomycetota bacterium]